MSFTLFKRVPPPDEVIEEAEKKLRAKMRKQIRDRQKLEAQKAADIRIAKKYIDAGKPEEGFRKSLAIVEVDRAIKQKDITERRIITAQNNLARVDDTIDQVETFAAVNSATIGLSQLDIMKSLPGKLAAGEVAKMKNDSSLEIMKEMMDGFEVDQEALDTNESEVEKLKQSEAQSIFEKLQAEQALVREQKMNVVPFGQIPSILPAVPLATSLIPEYAGSVDLSDLQTRFNNLNKF